MIIDVNVNLSRWPFRRLPHDDLPKFVAQSTGARGSEGAATPKSATAPVTVMTSAAEETTAPSKVKLKVSNFRGGCANLNEQFGLGRMAEVQI